jgi:hypothetical protein
LFEIVSWRFVVVEASKTFKCTNASAASEISEKNVRNESRENVSTREFRLNRLAAVRAQAGFAGIRNNQARRLPGW